MGILRDRLRFWPGQKTAAPPAGVVEEPEPSRVVWMFPTRGKKGPSIPLDLYENSEVFRQSLAQCSRVVEELLGWSVVEELLRGPDQNCLATSEEHMESALAAIQIALFDLLRSRHLQPDAVLALSGGEYPAAYASGAVSAREAMELACHSSLWIRTGGGVGRMLRIDTGLEEVMALAAKAPQPVYLSATFGPACCVVATEETNCTALADYFASSNVGLRVLPWVLAYHSPLMEPWRPLPGLTEARIGVRETKLPSYSAAQKGIVRHLDAAYWWNIIAEPAWFAEAAGAAIVDGHDTFLEIASQPMMVGMIEQIANRLGKKVRTIPLLQEGQPWDSAIEKSLTNSRILAAGVTNR